jgi:hypothetical protein
MSEHVVNLYMHEVAMHVDHNVEEFKPPFTEEGLRGSSTAEPDRLSPAHISALSTCLSSIDGIFETFLSLDVEVIRALPIFQFVRVAYAVVALIKMYFAAATPNSELGKVIDKDNMKVDYYLDGLLETFRATAEDEKSRPASKFLMVLVMLKTWFHRQKDGKVPPMSSTQCACETQPSAPSNGADEQAAQQHNPQAPEFSPANTPLQLLSEVATGNSSHQSRPESRQNFKQTDSWQLQQSYNYAPRFTGQEYPAVQSEVEINLGDGYEDTFGIALGEGEFGNYFSDEPFFGAMMDTVGGTGNFLEGV